jgi:O-antigen/teichoic acid export membrane protein
MSELAVRRVLLKNTTIQLLAQAVALLTGLGNSLVLSRYLGVEGFGQFNYVFAFYYFFLTLNDFGINTIVVREISRQRERAAQLIGAMLTFKLGFALMLFLCAAVAVWTMPLPIELRSALWGYGLVLPILALQMPTVMFQVNLQFEYPAIVATTNRCVGFILVLGVVLCGGSLLAVIAALVLSECVSLGLLCYFTKDLVQPAWQLAPSVWGEVLRSSIPLGLAGLCTALINRADFIMLERMTDLRQLGLYSAAYKVTSLLETFPLIFMGTIYPLMSRWATEDPGRMKRLYWQSMLFLGLVAVPIGAIVTIAAPWIVQLLFGSTYSETVPALRVLVWASVALYMAITSGNLLISMGRERINLMLNVCGAALNILLNFWFIPQWGFVGAAWATTITFVFVLVGVTLASVIVLRTVAVATDVQR